jgi:hypothetical protein
MDMRQDVNPIMVQTVALLEVCIQYRTKVVDEASDELSLFVDGGV